MGNHEQGCGRLLVDPVFEVVDPDHRRGAERNDAGAGQADRLIDGGSVIDQMSGLDDHLVLEALGIGQEFDAA